MAQNAEERDPLDVRHMASLKHWGARPEHAGDGAMPREVAIECGWGRLIFGQTFDDPARLAAALDAEEKGRRDVALYIREPHVVLSHAPQSLFIDPSLTYRLPLRRFDGPHEALSGIVIRPLASEAEEAAINRIYLSRRMVPADAGFYWSQRDSETVVILVAEDIADGQIVGVVTGVDHRAAFGDPDNGASLWALAVDPQARRPGIGGALVIRLASHFKARGRSFMDLSVMHDNAEAIALYGKLGFEQVPVYCLKRKNPINEKLFIGPAQDEDLNIYARIIVDEARRRGIGVEVLDGAGGFFRLTYGGRSITCREALSELTSAVAMSRCDDKTVTRRVLAKAGLTVPEQIVAGDPAENTAFLERHGRIVVKPARGEQGRGVFVDISTEEGLADALKEVCALSDCPVLEQFVDGEDLRVVVIDHRVVAAAIRRPARIEGDGRHSVRDLIEKQSRRRAAATDGESAIPLDEETERCVRLAGYTLEDVPPANEAIVVRKAANLHTGGTIHDVTEQLHPALADAAVRAARALDMPVVGLDFMVTNHREPDYVIIEANERPGLANHEPQPTVERFVDLLFPQSRTQPRQDKGSAA